MTGIEAVGAASAIVTLVQVTFESTLFLYEKIRSWQEAPAKVRSLRDELSLLKTALESLRNTATENNTANLDALQKPLDMLDRLCKDFAAFIEHNTTHSTDGKISKRDWVKLEYRGGDITDFKDKLASYRLTILVAIGDANLRTMKVTHQTLSDFRETTTQATNELKEQQDTVISHLSTLTDPTERATFLEETQSLTAALSITTRALDNAKPEKVNLIEDNISSQFAVQAIIPSELYTIHARGNKAEDQSTQFIGDIKGSVIQDAINARMQAQLAGRSGPASAGSTGERTQEQVDGETSFLHRYGPGQKRG